MKIIKPPSQLPFMKMEPIVFLAGTIEMGNSEDWQTIISSKLVHVEDGILLNPRRDTWDNSWGENSEELHAQIAWELQGQELADIIVFNFEPGSTSIITMLEYGLAMGWGNKKVAVRCEGYFRKTNIIQTSKVLGAEVEMVSSLVDLATWIEKECLAFYD